MPRETGNAVTIGGQTNNYYWIDWTPVSEPSNNRTLIYWSVGFRYTNSDAQLDDGDASLNGLRYDNGGRVKNFTSTFTTRDHIIVPTQTFYIDHNTNGEASITISGSIGGSLSARSTISQRSYGLENFNRSALQASRPSVSRSSNGQTLFYSATDPGALLSGPQRDFDWQYRAEGGGYVGLGATAEASGSSVNVGPAGQHVTYYVRVLAYNSDGNNGWSVDSFASHGIPNTPSNPSAIRSTTVGGRIDLAWGSPSYIGGALTKYQVYRNGTLVKDSGTETTFADTGLVKGTTYNYTVNAVNSTGAGTSTTTFSAMAPGVPSPPGIPTVTNKVGRNLTINSSRTSLNYGNNITEYRIQLSTDDGATWKGWDNSTKTFTANGTYNTLDSGGNITYELLAPALTYKWRTYAVNSIGDGEISTMSTGVFVSSGGKRWTGTEWTPTETAKRWDGTQWLDLTIAKRWDGSSWVDLT